MTTILPKRLAERFNRAIAAFGLDPATTTITANRHMPTEDVVTLNWSKATLDVSERGGGGFWAQIGPGQSRYFPPV